MSELGSGSGTSYPGSLDTDNTLEENSPNPGKTKARAEVPNDLAAAIIAIETELGTDPAGTLTDVKTFLQTEHGTDGTHTTDVIAEKTATAGVTVDGCLIKDGYAASASAIEDQGGSTDLSVKVVDIGDWDMDTTNNIGVAHGLTLANIRCIKITIRNDAASGFWDILYQGSAGTGAHGWSANSTNVVLSRQVSGQFDSTDFDSTSYNRGWITIWYV